MRTPVLVLVTLIATACSVATPAGSATSAPATSSAAPPAATARATAPGPTPAPLPPLPDLTGDLTWFAPLPPLPTGPGRPFIGSDDFMGLFEPGADWAVAASHVEVFKLYGEWVAYGATDAELAQAVRAIRRLGMALAVEAGPLDPEGCGEGIEGFPGSAEGTLIADRIERAGGTIDLVALDEPYYFASIYDGPRACRWTAEKVAAEVGEYVEIMRARFPDVVVGDTEPTPEPVEAETYTAWLETFRAVNGYDLAFLHLDVDWARVDWPIMVDEIVAFGRAFGVPIGMIYIGNPYDPTDEVNISVMGERALRLEGEFGVLPPHVLFQSWIDRPDRVLPESEPYTFTWLIRTYFEDRANLGFRREGAGANVALGKTARASHSNPGNEPGHAVDGDTGTLWSAAGFPPQWIEIDLGGVFDIVEVRLVASQSPPGRTVHRVLGGGPDTAGLVELGVLDDTTADGSHLVLRAEEPWKGLDLIRVETVTSPSWVAWFEIEVRAAG